jgi:Family of unknown function (DUF6350)
MGRGVPEPMGRSLRRAAVWTGGFAAAAGAVLGALVGLVCWLPAAGVSGHPLSAVRAGVLGFLASQHGGLTLDGVPTSLSPLLGVSIVAMLAWRAGTTLAEIAAQLRERRRRALVQAGLVQALSYALACLVLVPLSALGTTSAPSVPMTVAAFGLFGCVALMALLRTRVAVRAHVVAGLRGAAGALAVYIGGGALLVAGSLVLHANTVMMMSRQVGGGFSGLPILVLGIACAPNAAVAGAAYIAGPGFAIGSGATFTAFSTPHAVLPAFPLLGALPSGPANPVVLGWLVVTLVGAGLVAARLAGRRHGLRGVAVAAAAGGCGLAVLAWLGGGAVGAGRLHTVGASPWRVGLAAAGEIAAVGLVYVTWRALRRRFTRRRRRRRFTKRTLRPRFTVGALPRRLTRRPRIAPALKRRLARIGADGDR